MNVPNVTTTETKSTTKFRIFLVIIIMIVIIIGMRVSYVKRLRRELIFNSDDFTNLDSYYEYGDYKISNVNVYNKFKISYIKRKIKRANEQQFIHNQDRHGKVKPTTFVIVIQVHDEIVFLKGLLESLKYTMGITNSLLIFSHGYYNNEINELIHNITFAKYVQIFYPFSSQLSPSAFPGDDPQLCTGDFECEPSIMRVASRTQMKHFWWWQLSYVFDRLRAIKNYDGFISFLEEDQYVLMDYLFMLKVMESIIPNHCPDCEIISLGAFTPNLDKFHVKDGNLTITSWNAIKSNMGIAFNRSVWNSIKKYRYHFCHYNDYRWDRSLKYLASNRPRNFFKIIASDASRVIRLKGCNDNPQCSLENIIKQVVSFARTIKRGLFPRNVAINTALVKTDFNFKEVGDWEDVRDQELCMHFIEE